MTLPVDWHTFEVTHVKAMCNRKSKETIQISTNRGWLNKLCSRYIIQYWVVEKINEAFLCTTIETSPSYTVMVKTWRYRTANKYANSGVLRRKGDESLVNIHVIFKYTYRNSEVDKFTKKIMVTFERGFVIEMEERLFTIYLLILCGLWTMWIYYYTQKN